MKMVMNGYKPTYRTHKIEERAGRGIRLFDKSIKGQVDVKKVIDKFIKRKIVVGHRYHKRSGKWSKVCANFETDMKTTDRELIITCKIDGLVRRLTIRLDGMELVEV